VGNKRTQRLSTIPEGTIGTKLLPDGSIKPKSKTPKSKQLNTAQPLGIVIPNTAVKPFGVESSDVSQYPNDTIILDVYNAVNVFLESNYRINTSTKRGSSIELDVEEDIRNLGYVSGKYIAEYKFHRNYLGSGDGHKVLIQEVSSDGLEVRITAAPSSTISNANYLEFFSKKLFTLPKKQTLTNLSIFKQTDAGVESYGIFDYIQDIYTLPITPYAIILKLNSPLPTTINVGDRVWVAQQMSDTITDTIVMVPPKRKPNQTIIAGPNWDVISKVQTNVTTPYKDWDDILTTNHQTTEGIVNSLLSGSLIEGIKLNVDYRKFKNHIVLGSAAERLENFRYKVALLEDYDSKLAILTTNLIGSPSSGVSSSLVFKTNLINTQTKRAALLGGFDSYEKYVYNNSSSYESSSYGEFYPSTWPKSNSSKPYVNYSITSSQVADWYQGVFDSASLFDNNNDQSLYKLIPAHVLEDASNDQYTLLVSMMGHYFDTILLYIKQITETTDRQQSIYEGFSKELIYNVAESLGINFENGNVLEDLWSYTLGTNASGSIQSQYEATGDDKTKEIWKRIINNLPYLLKTKGTERGVRALINCYGIPQTILRIREYGGAEPEFDTKTDLQYERFNYALNVGWNNLNSGGTDPSQLISTPWQKLVGNGLIPMSVQLRVKMAKGQTKTQTILEVPEKWKVQAFQSASGNYLGFYLSGSGGWATASVSSSIYDGTFHSITLQRSTASDNSATNQTYTLIAKKVNYDKVVSTQTASLYIDNTSGSYHTSFVSTGSLWIPGSGSYTYAESESMQILSGSVQELRYWSTPMQNAILNNHALTPTSFQGNTDEIHTGSTSSFADLAFRLCLGSDNKKIEYNSTASITSQHPNQTEAQFVNSIPKTSTFYRFKPVSSGSYEPLVEKHSLEWPDLGGNRSVGTKIRIENTTTAGTGPPELWRDNKTQRSLADTQPPDSSRLGIYLSPQNEINQDIAEQFGGISIDDYIGDPSHLALDTYPTLDRLKYEYSKKLTQGRNNTQNYIRLIKHYDASLFQLIKKFVPYRANTQVGLVLEPTIIERSKIRSTVPTFEELQHSSSIDARPDTIWTVGGAIQDGDGESNRNQPGHTNNGYVPEGVIGGANNYIISLKGEEQSVSEYYDIINYPTHTYKGPRHNINMIPDLASPEVDYVILDGTKVTMSPTFDQSYANQFNSVGVDDNLSTAESTTGLVDLGVSQYGRDTRVEGTQYTFMTWATSGSGASVSAPYQVTSSHYAYSEALNPTVITSRYSETFNNSSDIYGLDVFANKAFTGSYALETGSTRFTESIAFQNNKWTSQYGLRISSSFTGSGGVITALDPTGEYHWGMNNINGLYLINTAQSSSLVEFEYRPSGNYSGSIALHAFYFEPNQKQTHDYLYDISITLSDYGLYGSATVTLFYGSFNSIYTQDISVTSTPTTYTFRTKADGNSLGILGKVGYAEPFGRLEIRALSVKSINYRAEVQDFHLRDSYGMRNARYDGCKMTSADYNIDSPDTVDGGPVITITTGTGVELVSKPSARGNFQIR